MNKPTPTVKQFKPHLKLTVGMSVPLRLREKNHDNICQTVSNLFARLRRWFRFHLEHIKDVLGLQSEYEALCLQRGYKKGAARIEDAYKVLRGQYHR